MKKEKNNLEALRHSLAHIMMQALENLYQAIPGVGPAIDNGFYHDFDAKYQVKEEDLVKIETEMKKIIKQDLEIKKKEMPVDEGIKFLQEKKYKYTAELAEDLKSEGEKGISFYEQGDFINMCKGPHLESTGKIKPDAFKLIKVAGAYWRGDEKNKMIQRIYSVAFNSKKELDDYSAMMEEAEKRDHRKLGKELDLFMIAEEVGQGLVMYLPKGAFIYKKLQDYMYEKEYQHGYSFVLTPVLAKSRMYEQSGHLSHYHDDMYSPIDIDGEDYYLKPMNCPHHHIMYKNGIKSYRDLPLRIADFGMIHRYERSGVLTGIIRARNFCQNDAHIYCTKEQIKGEFIKVLQLFDEVYQDFNIKDYWFRLSLPDYNDQEKYGDLENREMWEYSADVAREAMKEHGVKFEEVEGEAAFYGPKIDVQTKNVLGKEDTIATIQVDFYMPEKFDLTFINNKSEEQRPVIIHRAIMGSFDRFLAFLIEKTGGNFPVWLSPVQVKVISVSEKHIEYCQNLADEFKAANIRVEVDISNETVGNKIRKAVNEKVPYMLVVGDKEIGSKNLAVRDRGQKDTREIEKKEFIKEIKEKIENRD